MDKVSIGPMVVSTHLGWMEAERKKKQEVRVTLEFELDTEPAGSNEALDKTVDFEIAKEVKALVAEAETKLVETLALNIANHCLSKDGVTNVRVTVEKRLPFDRTIPGAVTIFRKK